MIRAVEIENFKSIERLRLELGRVTVLIGENGCGKSNILEGVGLAGAASRGLVEPEFLASRGIRVAEPAAMRALFPRDEAVGPQRLRVEGEGGQAWAWTVTWTEGDPARVELRGDADGIDLDQRQHEALVQATADQLLRLARDQAPAGGASRDVGAAFLQLARGAESGEAARDWVEQIARVAARRTVLELRRSASWAPLADFTIFTPENSALRTFEAEGQIRPVGVHGEGLFHHLKELSRTRPEILAQISERLSVLDWFEGFQIPADLAPFERTLAIRDRYLVDGRLFDQRSANEGFLYLLLYFTLLLSPTAPRIFAIDNVEASLNPKLCAELVRQMVALAREGDRQIILTTHSPAVLDGLDLSDEEQVLYAVERRSRGDTRIRRVNAPRPLEGEPPVPLSEAFMRGYIGGLPRNF